MKVFTSTICLLAAVCIFDGEQLSGQTLNYQLPQNIRGFRAVQGPFGQRVYGRTWGSDAFYSRRFDSIDNFVGEIVPILITPTTTSTTHFQGGETNFQNARVNVRQSALNEGRCDKRESIYSSLQDLHRVGIRSIDRLNTSADQMLNRLNGVGSGDDDEGNNIGDLGVPGDQGSFPPNATRARQMGNNAINFPPVKLKKGEVLLKVYPLKLPQKNSSVFEATEELPTHNANSSREKEAVMVKPTPASKKTSQSLKKSTNGVLKNQNSSKTEDSK